MSRCEVCEERPASAFTVRVGMNLFTCDRCEQAFAEAERRVLEAIRFNGGLAPLGIVSSQGERA